MSDFAPPGYYPGKGDPPGTVRAWDGTRWTSEPMPPPPGWEKSGTDPRFATFWIRVGASLLDGVVALVIALPVMIPWLIDLWDQLDAGVEADQLDATAPLSFYAVGLLSTALFITMTALLGGTPGKLILKLRVTTEDGRTTPPGFERAARRFVPSLLAVVPVIGPLIGLTVQVLSAVWVHTDPERRSAYDRIAGTRVVHANRL